MERATSGVIPFEFEIVEVVSDSIEINSRTGKNTVGQWLDHTIAHHLENGLRLGKVSVDLGEFFEAHADPAYERDQANARLHDKPHKSKAL